jgi:hypothetical protein
MHSYLQLSLKFEYAPTQLSLLLCTTSLSIMYR